VFDHILEPGDLVWRELFVAGCANIHRPVQPGRSHLRQHMPRKPHARHLLLGPVGQALLLVEKDQVIGSVGLDDQGDFDLFFVAFFTGAECLVDGGDEEYRVEKQVVKARLCFMVGRVGTQGLEGLIKLISGLPTTSIDLVSDIVFS